MSLSLVMLNRKFQLWPIRSKPLPDELLSSWLVRLAHDHGLKAQSFCHLIAESDQQIWNRDVDRTAPTWLIEKLCNGTGLPITTTRETTLRAYEGVLYPKFHNAGTLSWILTLKMYHRKRKGFGLQFCPQCLAEDVVPYFRKRWRIALNTTCYRHQTPLLDRCQACGHPVSVHRIDMHEMWPSDDLPLSRCSNCGGDLKQSVISPIQGYADDASRILEKIAQKLEENVPRWTRFDIEELAVLRHLTALMTSRYKHDFLREYVADQLHIAYMQLGPEGLSIEGRSWEERRHLIQLAAWLLADLEHRLPDAWKAGAIRYNLLFKGFDTPPEWYRRIVAPLSNWRSK